MRPEWKLGVESIHSGGRPGRLRVEKNEESGPEPRETQGTQRGRQMVNQESAVTET